MSWFPRPETPDDVQLLPASSLTRERCYALLTAVDAVEWRDKVGVYGIHEGSGKTTTRLLCTQDWVFKTDRSHQGDYAEVMQYQQSHQQQAMALGVYHPDKQWLLLQENEHWLPVTACPRLQTLRARQAVSERLQGWLDMYQLGARLLRDHQIELDLNPANFGSIPGSAALWYLDDEWYPGQVCLGALGLSLAHRLAESDDLSLNDWRQLGTGLRDILAALGFGPFDLRGLHHHLEEYPLRGAAILAREQLLQSLWAKKKLLRKPRPRRTCILADIHANLPALEAVLAAAHDMGVSDYLLLGDLVGYGPHPQACVERVADLPLMAAVRGNHDQALVSGHTEPGMRKVATDTLQWTRSQLTAASLHWLSSLPTFWRQGPVMAVHGSLLDPEHMSGYIYEMTYENNLQVAQKLDLSVLFFGHTHFPAVYRQRHGWIEQRLPAQTLRLLEPGTCILLNPGSVGQPRDRDTRAAFALWEHSTQYVHFFRQPYVLTQTLHDLRRYGLSEHLAQRLEAGL